MQSHTSNCKCSSCILSSLELGIPKKHFHSIPKDTTLIHDEAIGSLDSSKLYNTQSIVKKHTVPLEKILLTNGFIFESIESITGHNHTQNAKSLYFTPVISTITSGVGDGTLYSVTDSRLIKATVFKNIETKKGKLFNYDIGADDNSKYKIMPDLSKLISEDSKNLLTIDSDGLLTVKIDPDGYLEKGNNGLRINQTLLNKINNNP